jgi:hypothetical protein
MDTRAMFQAAAPEKGMYESFYLRAFSPDEPVGIWIRYTVQKHPGATPTGSLWCTRFDARREGPFMHKLLGLPLSIPAGQWLAVGDATIGPEGASGRCGEASWRLRVSSPEPGLRHLSPKLLYRLPLPRTKLTSPAPRALLSGSFQIAGQPALQLDGWQGMVGHNWGTEHAERWIWIHGTGFSESPEAWIDLALGRVMVGGRMTPWVANGTLCLDGGRHRLGGLLAGAPRVRASVSGCEISVRGSRGLEIAVRAHVPARSCAGWRYEDPGGGGHDVANCSVAGLELTVVPGTGAVARTLHSDHGGAYELGMRERDHGVPIAPFPDA